VVVILDARSGEHVAAGQLIARLADLSGWQVETVNLTELNVARVNVGQEAALAFDAVPDLKLTGKVTAIRGLGESRQGDTVYTVVVTPAGSDPALRWNMTAQVTFAR
jgi:HlyD family secretion protein